MKRIWIAAAFAVAASPASAMTGAELLTFAPDYGRGYVWGVVDLMSNMTGSPEITANSTQIFDCLLKGRVSDQAMYLATVAYIQNNPEAMTVTPIGAVNAVLTRMCRQPSQ